VLLAGSEDTCAEWQRTLERQYRPRVRVFNVGGTTLPAALAKARVPASGAAAWICMGTQCLPPVMALEEAARALDAGLTPRS
jgi:uncharacterized protein YyaL (SSP411 family)